MIIKNLKIYLFILIAFFNGCNGKLPGGDARKFPADPKKELKKILKKDEDLN
jgi:hypothetical protein